MTTYGTSRGPYRFWRLMAVGLRTHVLHLSRSGVELVMAVFSPLVFATLAVYLFRAGDHPDRLLQAAVGAGLMGVWSAVLFGAGGAIQEQRWMGTLETLVSAPTRFSLVLLPITFATALVGLYSLVATVVWGVVLFDIPFTPASPWLLAPAMLVCVVALGMMGILMAATFVLLRNANALANALDYPVWMFSGVLVSTASLPAWTRPVTWALPTSWAARAVQAATSGGEVLRPSLVALGLGAGYAGLALIALVWVERRARSAGTLALT
ncbi:ABC transporter permease [Streptomyces sp. NPDC091259]|uniref:ABC transporter permease n=1 Tax=Streptomyces sp. NPDC091259 TaxID=3365976 RepID=UPI00382F82BE